MAEFVIVMPLLAVIFGIGVDFGRAFTAYIAVNSAAREGAAYGMLSTANSNDTGTISSVVSQEAGTLFGSTISGSSTTGTDSTGNRFVSVTATYTFNPLMNIPPIPGSITMTQTVRMRVIN